jgi:hypothetical protein
MTTTTSRRSVLAGIAAAPALAAPALALTGFSENPVIDPIFAAIERYKTAVRVRAATLAATWNGEAPHLAHLPKNAPECIAADRLHDAAAVLEFEALDHLLATSPTTITGAAAFLEYLALQPYNPDGDRGRDPTIAELASERGDEGDPNSPVTCLTNLASNLRTMAKAGAVS